MSLVGRVLKFFSFLEVILYAQNFLALFYTLQRAMGKRYSASGFLLFTLSISLDEYIGKCACIQRPLRGLKTLRVPGSSLGSSPRIRFSRYSRFFFNLILALYKLVWMRF